MPCCGQGRRNLTAAMSTPSFDSNRVFPPGVGTIAEGPMVLEYLATAPVVARGAVTGAEYHFAGRGARRSVARPDGPGLIASSFFRRID